MITNNNFYYIDKDIWISSFDIIRKLRKILNIKKIWHTGTLDPLASWGVLLACGNYTKLIPYLEKANKTYEFIVNIDWTTKSFDLAEEIQYFPKDFLNNLKKELNEEKIKKILQTHFLWEIEQIPPKYSALKINWQRAYSLARKWKDFEIKKRKITIYEIKLLKYSFPKIHLQAKVSAWTYIRSIANDLGRILSKWWYISFLRRTYINSLSVSQAQKLENFDKTKIIQEKLLFPKENFISLSKNILQKINQGQKIKWNFNFPKNQNLFVLNNWKISNIVFYDWEYLIAKKKI